MGKRSPPVDAAEMNLKLRSRQILRKDGELPLGPSGLEGVDHKKQPDRHSGRIEQIDFRIRVLARRIAPSLSS
jgi:hypothetical protein